MHWGWGGVGLGRKEMLTLQLPWKGRDSLTQTEVKEDHLKENIHVTQGLMTE